VPNPVRVIKRKVDGSTRSEWEGDLVAATDTTVTVFHDADVHAKTTRGLPWPYEGYAMHVVSLADPLTVLFTFDSLGTMVDAKCDAALPGELRGREVSFVDLDLDLVVLPDGTQTLRDLEKLRDGPYTPGQRATAWRGVRLARELIATRAFPFDGSPEALLGRTLAARGPL
jgi:predicted RNA-binding protein associated with RNAse of E/G family